MLKEMKKRCQMVIRSATFATAGAIPISKAIPIIVAQIEQVRQ